MRQALRSRPAQASSPCRPGCATSRCAASPTCGRSKAVPTYTEYFKEGDQVPGRLCPIHQGSIKQRVRRAVEGFLSGLGKRIGRIFSR